MILPIVGMWYRPGHLLVQDHIPLGQKLSLDPTEYLESHAVKVWVTLESLAALLGHPPGQPYHLGWIAQTHTYLATAPTLAIFTLNFQGKPHTLIRGL